MKLFVLVYIYVLLDIGRYGLCYKILFRTKFEKETSRYVITALLIATGIMGLSKLFSWSYDFSGNLMLLFGGLLIPLLWCRDNKLKMLALYPAVFALDDLLGSIYNFIVGIIQKKDAVEIGTEMSVIKAIICVLILYGVCFFVYKKYPDTEQRINKKQFAMYMMMMLISIAMIDGVEFILSEQYIRNPVSTNMMGLSLTLSCLILFFLCVWYGIEEQEKERQREQLILYEKFSYEQQLQVQKLLEEDERLRRIRHDLKNSYLCIDAMVKNGEYDEISKYCCRALNEMNLRKTKVFTNNTAIDAIVGYYLSQMTENGIRVEKNIQIDLRQTKEAFEYCTILSNLLKNALEAVVNQETEKWIRIGIRELNGHVCITIINPSANEPKWQGGVLLTSKKNKKEHGFGSKNVRDTVLKLNGNIDYQYQNNCFQVVVMI